MRSFAFRKTTSGTQTHHHETERPTPRKRAQLIGSRPFATSAQFLRDGTPCGHPEAPASFEFILTTPSSPHRRPSPRRRPSPHPSRHHSHPRSDALHRSRLDRARTPRTVEARRSLCNSPSAGPWHSKRTTPRRLRIYPERQRLTWERPARPVPLPTAGPFRPANTLSPSAGSESARSLLRRFSQPELLQPRPQDRPQRLAIPLQCPLRCPLWCAPSYPLRCPVRTLPLSAFGAREPRPQTRPFSPSHFATSAARRIRPFAPPRIASYQSLS